MDRLPGTDVIMPVLGDPAIDGQGQGPVIDHQADQPAIDSAPSEASEP